MNLLDILNAPWAIQPEKLVEIRDIYLARVRGERLDLAAIEAKLGREFAAFEAKVGQAEPDPHATPYQVTQEGIAIIPVDGVLAKRMNLLQRISGGTSTQLIMRDLKSALGNPAVRGILLAIDSPGGTVDGTQELAQLVFQGSEQKPIVAWSDGLVGSAAYWIASAAPQLFISGDVVQAGSIGVVATHVDISKAEEQRGIKTTEIVAGRYKRIASQHAPLSVEGRQALQDQVDYLYQIFVGEVARYRGKSPAQVLATMAEGRVFIGRQAIAAGLIDGIATEESVIVEVAAGRIGRRA